MANNRRSLIRSRGGQGMPTRSGSFINNESVGFGSANNLNNANNSRRESLVRNTSNYTNRGQAGNATPNSIPVRSGFVSNNNTRNNNIGNVNANIPSPTYGRNANIGMNRNVNPGVGIRNNSYNMGNNYSTNSGNNINFDNSPVLFEGTDVPLEELMKKQTREVSGGASKAPDKKSIFYEKYDLGNVSSSKYSLGNVEDYLSDKDREILSSSKARKILAAAEIAEKSISEQTRQDGNLYLEIAGTLNQGGGILSFKLKVVGLIIACIMIVIILFGYYLNTSNPLIPVIESSKKPFAINILDKNNVKMFSAVNMKEPLEDKLSPYLVDSLLALHGALEYEYQVRINSNEIKDDKSSLDNENVSINSVGKIKGLFENSSCVIYTKLSEFNSYNCRYSYPNFLINDFLRDISDNNFVSKLISYSSFLRNYLLVNWIEGNIAEKEFLDIYFNYVNYGRTYLGIDSAVKSYFNTTLNDLTLPQAVYLMNIIYNNNKNLYPSYDGVGVVDIVNQLVRNNVVESIDREMLIDEINAIHPVYENGVFSIYLEDMYNEAATYNLKVPSATVYSTFISTVQNAAVSMLEGSMKNLKIPNGSVVILNNNEIVAGTTFSITAGEMLNSFERKYYKKYPDINSYNSIKPFLYYALLKNDIDIPRLLLNVKYQNLLFSEHRIKRRGYLKELDKKLIANNKEIPRRTSEEVSALTNDMDLDSAPEEMRELFAAKLSSMETDLLKQIQPAQYTEVLQKIFINANIKSIDDIVDGKVTMNFMDLVKAYSALSVGGAFRSLDYISSINGNYYVDGFYSFSNIESQYVSIINNVLFNTMVPRDKKTAFRYIVDTNTLFAFSNNYVIGLWLGDLNNVNFAEDYSAALLSVFKDLSSIIGET